MIAHILEKAEENHRSFSFRLLIVRNTTNVASIAMTMSSCEDSSNCEIDRFEEQNVTSFRVYV